MAKELRLLKKATPEELANSLAAYLPGGPLFEASRFPANVDGKTFSRQRQLIEGLSKELGRAEDLINEYATQYLLDTTTDLISEWESALSIPDECFTVDDLVSSRRRNALVKLAAHGVQIEQHFIDLAALYGVGITIQSGIEYNNVFPMTFPFYFWENDKTARFTMIVSVFDVEEPTRFPFTFPFPFGDDILKFIECFFERLKPANVQIIWRYDKEAAAILALSESIQSAHLANRANR